MPLTFSVITCTWNSEPYVAQSIESVLMQDYPHVEYIFVDGGSVDGTLERIRSITRDIKLATDVRGGVSAAMNAGLRMATGDVIAHLHGDDYYLYPRVLSEVAELMESSGSEWLFGRGMDDVEGRLEPEGWVVPRYSFRRLLKTDFIPHASVFIRKRLIDKVGFFDEQLKYAMDYDWFLRLGRLADPYQLDRHLSAFRRHAGSISTVNYPKGMLEELRIRLRFAGLWPWWVAYYGAYYLLRRWRFSRELSASKQGSA